MKAARPPKNSTTARMSSTIETTMPQPITRPAIAMPSPRVPGLRRMSLSCLWATVAFGLAFLIIKGFEYAEDIGKHLIPGPHFSLPEPAAQIFWAFYWLLTAVHALHLTIGIIMVLVLIFQGWRHLRPLPSPAFEGAALYWHLVDMVWIYLYPLIYLPGRA